MKNLLLHDKKIVIASYTHIIGGTYTTLGGPALALKDYLEERAKKLMCVWQPLPISDDLSIIVEIYKRNGHDIRRFKLPFINWPFGRKKHISFIYLFLKLRDIFSVFFSFLFFGDKFDVYIGVEALDALTGVALRKIGLVKKVIYYNMDYGIKRFPVPLLNLIFHFLDSLAINNCDCTWILSEQMLLEREKKGIKNKKNNLQLVVPIGINFNKIKRLPLEEIDRKGVVYLGVLEELNGVHLLIDVFREILQRVPDASLLIIGSGEFELKLKQMVRDKNIQDQVKFTGIIPDEEVENLLCKRAIGIAPYLDDPRSTTRFTDPTKPKTYFSCGLPVIITKVPKIALDIDKAKAGIAINSNKEELTEALNKLLTDDLLYKEYRQNAITFAAQYDWKNIFDNAFAVVL